MCMCICCMNSEQIESRALTGVFHSDFDLFCSRLFLKFLSHILLSKQNLASDFPLIVSLFPLLLDKQKKDTRLFSVSGNYQIHNRIT